MKFDIKKYWALEKKSWSLRTSAENKQLRAWEIHLFREAAFDEEWQRRHDDFFLDNVKNFDSSTKQGAKNCRRLQEIGITRNIEYLVLL